MKDKLLIVSAGFLAVPGTEGAVETLITNFIDENEKKQLFELLVISVEGVKKVKKYKYCKIIEIRRNKLLRKLVYIKIMILRLLGKQVFVNEYYNYKVKKLVEKLDPDYQYILIENNMDLLLKMNNKLSKKYFYHIHNDDVNFSYNEKYLKKVEECFMKINTVISVSDFIANQIKNTVRFGNLIVVNNCVNINKFNQYNVKETSSDFFDVFYVGRLIKEKGIDKLITSFQYISKKEKIRLNIIADVNGIYNSYYHELLKIAKEFNIDCNFIGYVRNDRLNKIITRNKAILVIPTYYVEEAASVIAIEGLISGLPIIASDSGNLPYMIPKYAGGIVKRNEYFEKNLADKIMQIKNEYDIVHSQILNNRESLILKYSTEIYYERISQILRGE